ncbi:MAG: VWA domain-containing protein [Candidatus Aminicenantes bacterium]|nr:VWA domain-containing protein [Candidatus Aminicenantes bacterium]
MLLFILTLLFPILLFSQQEKLIFDYIFLLDTSGSMVGKPPGSGNIVIFPRVIEAINEFLADIEPPANVFVYPFDEGLHDTRMFAVTTKEDIAQVQDCIKSLSVEGVNTWIYRSLANAVDRINEFKQGRPDEEHIVIMYLYTDGRDNDRQGPYTMETVIKHFQIKRGKDDWLFYSTLGVELPEGDKRVLHQNEHVKLIEEEKGKVHPILLIENKISIAHYGNLWEREEGTRTALFGLHSKEKLPEGLQIRVRPEFPELSSNGLGVRVSPSEFGPQTEVEFTMNLVNFSQDREVCEGSHRLNLRLETNDPLVFVMPDNIEVKFLYEPPRTVTISPSHGEKFPISFGKLNIHKEETPEKEKILVLDYNTQALEKGGNLKLHCTPSTNNPSLLSSNNIFMNNEKNEYITVTPPLTKIPFKVVANKDLKSGKYKGTLSFESEDMIVTGKDLKSKKDESNIKFFNWSFVIPKKPVPFYVWLIILAIIIIVAFLIIRQKLKPPVISDLKLDIIEPERSEIDLVGKTEVKFGKDGEYLQNAKASFTIRAIKDGSRVFAVLDLTDGEVFLKKSGERNESTIFGQEKIFDGDTIKFGNYKARVSSFSLIRE